MKEIVQAENTTDGKEMIEVSVYILGSFYAHNFIDKKIHIGFPAYLFIAFHFIANYSKI